MKRFAGKSFSARFGISHVVESLPRSGGRKNGSAKDWTEQLPKSIRRVCFRPPILGSAKSGRLRACTRDDALNAAGEGSPGSAGVFDRRLLQDGSNDVQNSRKLSAIGDGSKPAFGGHERLIGRCETRKTEAERRAALGKSDWRVWVGSATSANRTADTLRSSAV